MNKNLLTLTTLTALLAVASAQIVSKGACPENVQVVEDFSVEKYLGKWYEYAKYPVYFEADGKCISAEYSLNTSGIVNVKNALVNEKTNANSDILGTATLISNAKLLVKFPVSPVINSDILGTATLISNAKLLVKFPVSPVITVSSNYWVLDTDYDNYTVVYSCTPVTENTHATIVWILTRQPLPEPTIIEKAVSVLKANDISLQDLKITNQISCNEESA